MTSASPAERELAYERAAEALVAERTGVRHLEVARKPSAWERHVARETVNAYLAASAEGHGIEEGWRDISSAPKSTQSILLIATRPVSGRPYVSDVYSGWWNDGGWARWPHVLPPTHWMPLPAAPTSTTREGEGGGK